MRPLMLILPLLLCACGRGSEKESTSQADILYSETLRIINAYADSLRVASDTLSLATDSLAPERLMAKLNAELDSLNMSMPPNTDLQLSEAQNDTIIMALESLIDLRPKDLRPQTSD